MVLSFGSCVVVPGGQLFQVFAGDFLAEATRSEIEKPPQQACFALCRSPLLSLPVSGRDADFSGVVLGPKVAAEASLQLLRCHFCCRSFARADLAAACGQPGGNEWGISLGAGAVWKDADSWILSDTWPQTHTCERLCSLSTFLRM